MSGGEQAGPSNEALLHPEDGLIPGLASLERDLAGQDARLREAIRDRAILLIGGAGTIGAATLRALIPFGPSRVTVVDQSENGLAELVRSLRGREWSGGLPELDFLPLDFSSALFLDVLRERAFDHVLSFAALKHVRSERDGYSIARMLQVNVLALRQLIRALASAPSPPARLFSVSTDKAADPASVMGASKRLMEAVLQEAGGAPFAATTARFANVAFSAGSLLDSWTHRMASAQPLACPEDTWRFLIRRQDAGRICLLAALCLEDGQVGVPSEAADVQEYRLQDLAASFLAMKGYQAELVASESQARKSVKDLAAVGRYPLLLTPRDTMGEKRQEAFQGTLEDRRATTLESLDAVAPNPLPAGGLDTLEDRLAPVLARAPARTSPGPSNGPPSREDFLAWLSELLPRFSPTGGSRSLDDRL